MKYIQTDCAFWLQWLLATFSGFLLSLCLIEVDVRPYIGVAQPLILGQRSKTVALWWLLASIISWSLIGK